MQKNEQFKEFILNNYKNKYDKLIELLDKMLTFDPIFNNFEDGIEHIR